MKVEKSLSDGMITGIKIYYTKLKVKDQISSMETRIMELSHLNLWVQRTFVNKSLKISSYGTYMMTKNILKVSKGTYMTWKMTIK